MTKQEMRQARLDAVRAFIDSMIDRTIQPDELRSLERLSDQTLHLLCAAIDQINA